MVVIKCQMHNESHLFFEVSKTIPPNLESESASEKSKLNFRAA